jgi:agmatine deiminase
MVPDYVKDRFAIADVLGEYEVGHCLQTHGAEVLEDCRDVWCRDFMPIQVGPQRFVQFLYAPRYLVEDDLSWDYITPPGLVYPPWLRALPPDRVRVVPLVLDGGSVIGNERVALVSERIFRDNIGWAPCALARGALARVLARELCVEHVEFVPEPPDDFTGHLDGSIRIVSADRVVVGIPPHGDGYIPPADHLGLYRHALEYARLLIAIAQDLGFQVIELIDVSYLAPECPPDNVQGLYANFLQLGPCNIYLPQWGIQLQQYDEIALHELVEAGFHVIPVPAHEFAEDPDLAGGAINCVTSSWQQ